MSAPKKILLIDDDEAIVDSLTLWLETEGYRVAQRYDADDLEEAAREEEPDLILSDILMPGVPGHLAAMELRSKPEFAHIPIVLMSASNDGEQTALEVGLRYCINKPFDLEEVSQIFRKALKS